ncbi:MAG: TonB family protein [Pseudomonadota bacterium]
MSLPTRREDTTNEWSDVFSAKVSFPAATSRAKIRSFIALSFLLLVGCQTSEGTIIGAFMKPMALNQSCSPTPAQHPVLSRGKAPSYPMSYIIDEISGYATIEFDIEESGKTRNIDLIEQSRKYFGGHLIKAAESWRFEPAKTHTGEPMTVRCAFRMHYSIDRTRS